MILCDAPEAEVDSATCPSGYRCFRMGEGVDAYGICFRDCDAMHACPDGWACGAAGRCEEVPPS